MYKFALTWICFAIPLYYRSESRTSCPQSVSYFLFLLSRRRAMNDSFVRKFHRDLAVHLSLAWPVRLDRWSASCDIIVYPLSHYIMHRQYEIPWSPAFIAEINAGNGIYVSLIVPMVIWAEKIGNKDSPQSPCDILQLLQSGESCGNPVNIFLPQQLYSTLYGSRKSGRMERQEKKRDMEQWKS